MNRIADGDTASAMEAYDVVERETRGFEPARCKLLAATVGEWLHWYKIVKGRVAIKAEYVRRELLFQEACNAVTRFYETAQPYALHSNPCMEKEEERLLRAVDEADKDRWPDAPPLQPAEAEMPTKSVPTPTMIERLLQWLQPDAAEPTAEPLSQYPKLDTERARTAFAKAIERGYMERTASGYKWLFGGDRGKARLAYFVERVYCPTPTDTLTAEICRQIEQLFGVNRLDRTMQQNADTGKSAAVKKWRATIDALF